MAAAVEGAGPAAAVEGEGPASAVEGGGAAAAVEGAEPAPVLKHKWNAATPEVNAWDGFNDPMTDIDAPHGLPDDGTHDWNATDFDVFQARADPAAVTATGPLSKTRSSQRFPRSPAPTAVRHTRAAWHKQARIS